MVGECLAQNRDQLQIVVDTVTNLQAPQKESHFLISSGTTDFPRKSMDLVITSVHY
jgi:hypothetical protein